MKTRPFKQVDVFTADALPRQPAGGGARRHRPRRRARCSTSPSGPTCRKPPSCCRRPSRAPTTACASSRPAASCPSPAIPRWAAATPGWRPAASPKPRAASCSNAPAAWCRSGATASAWPSPRRRCSAARPARALLAKVAGALGLQGAADRRAQLLRQRPGVAGPAARRRRHRAGAQARPPHAQGAGPEGGRGRHAAATTRPRR